MSSILKINMADLEGECFRIPNQVWEINAEYATAVKERDQAKAALELVTAELMTRINVEWEKYFDKKPTVDLGKAWIPQQKEHKKVTEDLTNATEKLNISKAMCNAISTKESMLKQVIQLQIFQGNVERRADKGYGG
jgi:hypothetical protein